MREANNIGFLRLMAAVGVLFGHTYNLSIGRNGHLDPISHLIHPYTPFNLGLPGMCVAAFFIMSGYLVAKSFDQREDLLAFIEARVLRIYPALIVAVVFCVFILGPIVTSLPLSDYFSKPAIYNYFVNNASLAKIHFRLPGVFADNPWAHGVNGSLWTLPIELKMYVMVAVVGCLGIIKQRAVFNALSLGLILIYIAAPESFPLLAKATYHYLGLSFLVGTFLYVNRDLLKLRLKVVPFLILLLFIYQSSSYYGFLATLVFGYSMMALGFTQVIRLPKVEKYGDLSYGIYLYAFPVQQLCIMMIGPDSTTIINIVSLAGAALLAFASWHLVEKRVLQLKGRLLSRFYPSYWKASN